MRRGWIWPAAAFVLALAACGGAGEAEREQPALSARVADRLAEQSDAIADTLDAGDTCGAAHQADELEAAVEQAIADGAIPPAFQQELLATARRLQSEVNCPEPPPPPPPEENCEELEEQKKALDEQKNDAEDEEKKQLEEQIKALDEQIKACKERDGDGDGEDD